MATKKFYHITTEESAKSIRANGFSASQAGSKGGTQMGQGVYLSQNPEYWEGQIFGHYGIQPVVQVTVEMDDIAVNPTEIAGFGEWLEANGWVADGQPTAKADEFVSQFAHEDDAIWQMTTNWLKDLGYKGMWQQQSYNLVVWDLSAIKEIE
jgi:hypothetical protein